MRWRWLIAGTGGVILVLATVMCGWFVWQFAAIVRATTPVVDVGEYGRVLAEWKEFAADIVRHFPEAVPNDAEEVSFYFWPGFLQSDGRIELRFRAGNKRIGEYYETFSQRATKVTRGTVLVHFRADRRDSDIIELGEDYEVMQFDADPDNLPEHSKEHGVIISREKQEIIFWAEW